MNERHNTSLYADYSYRGERDPGVRANVVSRHSSLPAVCILDRT